MVSNNRFIKKKQHRRAKTTDDIRIGYSRINQSRRQVGSRSTDDIVDKQRLAKLDTQRDSLVKELKAAKRNKDSKLDSKLLQIEIRDLDDQIIKQLEKDLVDLNMINYLRDIRGVANVEERKRRLDQIRRINDARRLGIENVGYINDSEVVDVQKLGDEVEETKVADLDQLTKEEYQLLVTKSKEITALLAELNKGNVIVIGDSHDSSIPFNYVTLLMKLSGYEQGQLLIEGPQELNNWGKNEYDRNHRAWNKKAWDNTIQADAAIQVRNWGWDVVSVDILDPNTPKTSHAVNHRFDRQYQIGTKIAQRLDKNDKNGNPLSTVIAFGRKHIEGDKFFKPGFDRWSGMKFSKQVAIYDESDDKNEEAKQRIWVMNRSEQQARYTKKPKAGVYSLTKSNRERIKKALERKQKSYEQIAKSAVGITVQDVKNYEQDLIQEKEAKKKDRSAKD